MNRAKNNKHVPLYKLVEEVDKIKTEEVISVKVNGILYEQIWLKDCNKITPTFVFYNDGGLYEGPGGIDYIDCVDAGIKKYIPFQDPKKFAFPKIYDAIGYYNEEELYNEILTVIKKYVDFKDHDTHYILTSWILLTWIYENSKTVPYLFFIGDIGSGKTRCLDILKELCRNTKLSSSISPAAIAHSIEQHRATILIDEGELLNSKNHEEIRAILNAGYKEGETYDRLNPNTMQVEAFNVYSPKAIAGTETLYRSLESRCITIRMIKTTKEVADVINDEDFEVLRGKLLMFRLWNQNRKFKFCKLPINGRLKELFMPLLNVTPREYRSNILRYALNLNNERLKDDSNRLEGLIFRAIMAFINNGRTRAKAAEILEWFRLHPELGIEVSDKEERSFKQKIARILKNEFHFRDNTHNEFIIATEHLENLKARYTLEDLDNIEDIVKRYEPELNFDIEYEVREDIKSNETSKNTENNEDLNSMENNTSTNTEKDDAYFYSIGLDETTPVNNTEANIQTLGDTPKGLNIKEIINADPNKKYFPRIHKVIKVNGIDLKIIGHGQDWYEVTCLEDNETMAASYQKLETRIAKHIHDRHIQPQEPASTTKEPQDLSFPSQEEWFEYLHYDTKFLTINDVTYALKRIRSEYYDVLCPKCNNQFIVRGTDKELQARLVMHTEKFHKDLEATR